jgi:hypothetical protein
LTPLFWTEFGYVAKAEDFILPMTLDQWSEFFSTWQDRVGFGSSPDDRLPAVFFLFWPALFRALGASIELAQRLQFALWFTATGLSMYVLMRQLTRSQIALAGASLVYMFNFYQEPVWQGVNIANLSALVALPLALAVTIAFTRNGRLLVGAALLALITVIGSGVGANPPMALIAMIPVPLYMIMYMIHRLATGRAPQASRMLVLAGVAVVLIVAVNAYWLIPQGVGLASGGPGQNFIGRTKSDAFDQLVNLSKFTGPLNVWRLQGAWTWYDGFLGVPYVPYAATYLLNPFAIIGSFGIPFAALLGLLATRSRKFIFLGVVGMLGLVLSMGVNGPFGLAYGWLWEHIPLFWVVRSPWYKATALAMLGLAPLAAIGIDTSTTFIAKMVSKIHIARRIPERRLGLIAAVLILASYLAYNAPIVRGSFFIVRAEDSPLPGLQVDLPDYLIEASSWLEAQPGDYRVLALPPSLRQTTDWGFTSYIPPIGELTSQAFINLVEPSEMPAALYRALLSPDSVPLADLLAHVGIRYILLQGDVSRPAMDNLVNEPIEDLLARHGLEAEKTFGPLTFYRVPDEKPLVWGTNSILASPFGIDSISSLVRLYGEEEVAILIYDQVAPETAWALLAGGADTANVSLRILGSGTDLVLDLLAAEERLDFAPGITSRTVALPGPDTYEVWQRRTAAEVSGLDPQARLRLATSFVRVGDRHVLVDGAPLYRDRGKPAPEEVHGWSFLGTFDGSARDVEITIWGLSPYAGTSELLILSRDERLSISQQLRDIVDNSVPIRRVFAYLAALPQDVTEDSLNPLEISLLPDAWAEPVLSETGESFRLIFAVQKYIRHLQIENNQDSERSIALLLRPRSFEIPRSLWIKVGDQFVRTYVLSPDRRHEIVAEGIRLPPGASSINLYSPDLDTILPGPTFASFDYVMPIVGGLLERERSFTVSTAGIHQLLIGLTYGPTGTLDPDSLLNALVLDGVDYLPEIEVDDSGRVASLQIELAVGEHKIRIEQKTGTALPIVLEEVENLDLSGQNRVEIEYRRSSSTELDISANSDGPFVLILNELYDPRWSASVGGKPVDIHFTVNGYANGFYIPQGGPQTIEIRFGIQRLANVSLAISIAAIVGITIGLMLNMFRRRDV